MRYVFGPFVLDSDTRQLLRAGREVPLAPKAFELLELLIRARPRALSRTRIHAALWPNTHVGATSLHVLTSQVRAALGDDALEPYWVRTVQRFGYAFRADVSEEGSRALAAASGQPRVTFEGRQWLLQEGANVLGRGEGVAVRIESAGISRQHARIVIRDGNATIEDLGSKNGTFVGDERVSSVRTLERGDVVSLGRRAQLVFGWNDEDSTQSESRG